jgi:hypothetical protein
MKKIILIIFLLFSLNSFAQIGFTDWAEETPNGNRIDDLNNNSLYMRNGVEIKSLDEWYFYKDCVIGTTRVPHRYLIINEYFVANEILNTIDTFANEQDWKVFIKLHDLEPWIWKRTYKYEWSHITWRNFFLLFSFGFYISIPLTIIMFVIVKRAIKRENFNKRKPYTITTLIIIGLFVLRYLLEIFPGSI